MHILPKGIVRIRHYGILHGSWKSRLFSAVKVEKKDYKQFWKNLGFDVEKCSSCKKGNLYLLGKIDPVRGPPNNFRSKNKKSKI